MAQQQNAEAAALIELMESRAHVYLVLSRCFEREVDEALATDLCAGFGFESNDEQLVRALGAMSGALAGIDDAGIEMLAVDFDRVFYGMGPLTARHAFPYESVYTSDRGIMMQDAFAQVARIYREQRLAKDESFTEPEDHIAVELAFMASLAQRTAVFLDEGLDDAAEETVRQQLSFLQEHLLNWADRFCMDLRRAAPGGFYEALADFTIEFLKADDQLLADMLD